MRKAVTFIIFITFIGVVYELMLSNILTSIVYAADSSQSAGLQSELNQLKQEIASKAAAIKSQIDKKIVNKAISGLVQSKSDSQITITTTDRNQAVLINKFTDYQYLGNLAKGINKDDFVVALGDIDDKNNLVARRVVKLTEPTQNLTKYILGQVKSASPSAILITQLSGQDLTLNVSKNTDYKLGQKTSSLKSISEGERIIAIGSIKPETGNLIANFIYIYPNPNTPSPSPSNTASPSATPRQTKK